MVHELKDEVERALSLLEVDGLLLVRDDLLKAYNILMLELQLQKENWCPKCFRKSLERSESDLKFSIHNG